MQRLKQSGFALIGLILVLVIITILVVVVLGRGGQQDKNTITTGQQAEQQLKNSNQKLQDYQKQLQQSGN